MCPGQRLVVQGGHLVAGDVVVPGDISSAACGRGFVGARCRTGFDRGAELT